ncbi:MAG: inositol-3-phosphate synthase, partial [Candidatus Tectomicrobia bacterium]
KKGLGRPIGSVTQYGTIRLGKRTDNNMPLIKDFVPLATLDDLVFGCWDIFADNGYEAAVHAGVIEPSRLEAVRDELEAIRPWKAVFDQNYVRRLSGPHVKTGKNKYDLAMQLMEDIETFQGQQGVTRMVMIWCGSTEVFMDLDDFHKTLRGFERGLKENHAAITPSMTYAYAALMSGVPFGNGAPNLCVDIPALLELSENKGVPVCGKDFKTGQTLIKTIVAPGLKARQLGLNGWFSTNILGNRDGDVLHDPESFRTKEHSKLSVLDYILQPELHEELYGNYEHQVHIHYYKPRGDNKEGWDNIDIFGWLDYPMQIKINFLCRDSILAAPVLLDLVLFMDLAKRSELSGIQEWLSFYFKSPMCAPSLYPEHDLFVQFEKLNNTLRYLRGEEQITHLGLDYYQRP